MTTDEKNPTESGLDESGLDEMGLDEMGLDEQGAVLPGAVTALGAAPFYAAAYGIGGDRVGLEEYENLPPARPRPRRLPAAGEARRVRRSVSPAPEDEQP